MAKTGDVYAVIFHLKAGMLRNFGGLTNPKLFEKTNIGTKVLIEEVRVPLLSLDLEEIPHPFFSPFPLFSLSLSVSSPPHSPPQYTREVVDQLDHVHQLTDNELSVDQKAEFFASCYRTYGRSALILQGSVAFGQPSSSSSYMSFSHK